MKLKPRKRLKIFRKAFLFPFLLSLSFSLTSFGQLKVNIVPVDTTYCIGLYFEQFALGSELEVENAQGPYEVSWECNIPITDNITVTANGLFVNKTVPDPIFKVALWNEWYKIKVNVKDSLNNIASDSVNIRFSSFVYTLGYFEMTINLGDSLYIEDPIIAGGVEPLSWEYFPKDGLSNPLSLGTWLKPSETTTYYLQATDSCGCVSEKQTVLKVNVISTNLPIVKSKDSFNVIIFDNNLYFDNPGNKETSIFIYSAKGEMVLYKKTNSNNVDISILKNNPSIYLVKTIRGNFMDVQKIKF